MANPFLDIIDDLEFVRDGLKKKSRYKRYSKGLRSAFANRAYGVAMAIRHLRVFGMPDEPNKKELGIS